MTFYFTLYSAIECLASNISMYKLCQTSFYIKQLLSPPFRKPKIVVI